MNFQIPLPFKRFLRKIKMKCIELNNSVTCQINDHITSMKDKQMSVDLSINSLYYAGLGIN